MQKDFDNDEIMCGYTVTQKMKRIWAVQLDMLKVFKDFCEKHNLRYYMWSGTLLGAVRHQGFIPWDDDVDVVMPREDYIRFQKLAVEELPFPYHLQTNENDFGTFRGGLCRLRNSNTTGVEYRDIDRISDWGIWIDILALDYLYANQEKRIEQMRKIGILQRLCILQTYGEDFYDFQKLSNLKKKIYRLIVKKIKHSVLLRKFNEACMVCDEATARYVGVFTGCTHVEEYQCLYKADFLNSVELSFEGLKLAAPMGYDRYLGMVNGNYLEYPPKEQRVPHHEGIFDPSTPYQRWQYCLAETFHNTEGKIIVIFGAGNMFEDYMRRYGNQYRPAFIVDNGRNKWGKMSHGLMIHSPEELLTVPKESLRVIICNIYYREIVKQLDGMGIEDFHLHIENRFWLNDILFPKPNEKKKLDLAYKDLEFVVGQKISSETGMIEPAEAEYMVTASIHQAVAGDRISLLNLEYEFAIATYSNGIDGTYIYTYCYQKEENWTSYNHDYSENSFRTEDYIFHDTRYFRICLKHRNQEELSLQKTDTSEHIIQCFSQPKSYQEKPYFADEIRETATKILKKKTDKSLTLAILADSHYTIGGTWEDTAHTIREVHHQASFDGIVHLGDITDGMVPKRVTKFYAGKVLGDLMEHEIPLYVVPGNHDSNYFAGNPEPMTEEEQYELYQISSRDYVIRTAHEPWYYADDAAHSLRMLFLSSFDPGERVRYGFPAEELDWVQRTLDATPSGYSIVVFSHVPPLPEIHYWSDSIRNGEELIALLETYDEIPGNRVIAYVHGHNHTDQVYTERRFPIISIGCCKCESFEDKKPEGAVTAMRRLGTVSQELWDTMIITPSENQIEFIRFGAGEDKLIKY
ncbi:MAG: LicD family protein [Lachnospiraceae bacterium]